MKKLTKFEITMAQIAIKAQMTQTEENFKDGLMDAEQTLIEYRALKAVYLSLMDMMSELCEGETFKGGQ